MPGLFFIMELRDVAFVFPLFTSMGIGFPSVWMRRSISEIIGFESAKKSHRMTDGFELSVK